MWREKIFEIFWCTLYLYFFSQPLNPTFLLFLEFSLLVDCGYKPEQCMFNPNQAGVSESLIRQGGAGKWPAGENRLYWPYFCSLNIKNHIKGL